MCGIAGMFDRSGRRVATEGDLRQMVAMLRHRGPDEFGILLDREAGLGSARLSIIDLSGGSQPIPNEDESRWIVFNGEVFNYLELREELLAAGHKFRTASDTEVILHLYEELGPACLNRLNGQFAIAIWDTRKRELFLARDRLGVRPLFYTTVSGNVLLFASEIKALLSDPRVQAELDPVMVEEAFRFWAPLASHTVFRGIQEVPAGHFLFAKRGSVSVQQYWRNEFPSADGGEPDAEGSAIESFRDLLIDACRLRLRADVPVGAYLSGGLDSSTIAAAVRHYTSNRLVTFSIAFSDPRYDESQFQQEMAAHLGTEHHVVRVTQEDIGRAFPEVIWHAEAPILRTAPVPMFLLSKLVRQAGFKVVLTGEGADEFLAGYDIFKENKIRRFWAAQPGSRSRPLLLRRLYNDIGGFGRNSSEMTAAFFGEDLTHTDQPWYSHSIRWRNTRRLRRFFDPGVLAGIDDTYFQTLAAALPSNFKTWHPLAKAQFFEISIFLSQYLLSSQGDRMAMAHSVEGRFPFLDVRVVEFCNRLEPRLKLRGLDEKYLLKRVARLWLPESILNRRKHPYRAPVHAAFFNGHTPDYVRELLSLAALKETGLFNPGPVQQMVRKLESGSPLGETDDMALAGILSTQLIHHLFVADFRRPPPLSERDPVKVRRAHETIPKQTYAF